jgi:hypothetical protein
MSLANVNAMLNAFNDELSVYATLPFGLTLYAAVISFVGSNTTLAFCDVELTTLIALSGPNVALPLTVVDIAVLADESESNNTFASCDVVALMV